MKKAYSPKKRNTGTRQRKSIILIAAEGKNKTETLYFDAFNGGNVNIRFAKGNETDPVHLSRALILEYRKLGLRSEDGDAAYCVVDGDLSSLQEELIRKAEEKLKSIQGEVIVSNPCFEIWFLFHYIYTTKQFSACYEVIRTLKRYIPKYEKGYPDIQKLLADKTDTAILNAKKVNVYHTEMKADLKRYNCQPHTDVFKIVELILKKNGKDE